ncbi:C-type lectin domain family 4 member F-like [Paramisgurnus dabryanus]|uniref:C-type lectin domain family 4 member F-like n=1 Tax=Paramisgurnus dabryanus TaxID=90735 RepID=UPI003CCFC99C
MERKLTASLTTVTDQLSSCKVTERKLTANLNTVTDQLSVYKAMESELHKLKAKYNKLRASLYGAQSCDLSADGWTVCRGMIYFSTDKRDWASSRAVCVSMGADLVTITSQKEQDFLVSKIKETHWIGLNDLKTEGRWVWVNDQTLEETGVKFWYKRESGKNEPDNWKVEDSSGENCASLGNSSGDVETWFDNSCKEKKRFICEKK